MFLPDCKSEKSELGGWFSTADLVVGPPLLLAVVVVVVEDEPCKNPK